MNKSELVEKVAGHSGVDRRQAETVLSSYFETVRAEAKRGEKVSWPGFGSFATTKRKARTGTNPQTGASMRIPASTSMRFAPSSTLKDYLNTRGGAKKAAPKKAAAKKASGKKATAKKATAKKATAKRSTAKKASKKSPAKKAPAKKATKKATKR